jgi:hypothetical protein
MSPANTRIGTQPKSRRWPVGELTGGVAVRPVVPIGYALNLGKSLEGLKHHASTRVWNAPVQSIDAIAARWGR